MKMSDLLRFFHPKSLKRRNHPPRGPECPICHHSAKDFLPGPEGGAGQNVLCPSCLNEFVVTQLTQDSILFWQTIGYCDETRRKWLYPATVKETPAQAPASASTPTTTA